MAPGPLTDRRSSPAAPSGNADLHDLRLALIDRIADLASYALGGEPNHVLSSRREGRWGSKGSISVALSGPKRGQWFDHEAQEGGGPFDLVLKRIIRGEFADAVRWAREWLGWPAEGPAPAETRKAERRQERAAKIAAAEAEAAADRKHKIARAAKIWARTVPATGTPGETYLTKTRAVPVEAWPDAIRFDPVEGAVVFKATRRDGEFVGVQLVRVTPEGRKIAKDGDKLAKQSYGDFDGAAVRLPSCGDGPICIAEGPETGASVWAATGLETWIALGGVGKAEPIPSRKVIVARDDDKRDSPAARAVGRALKAWREAGIDCASAWPWAERRGDKSDFNDVLRDLGPDAVLARFTPIIGKPQRIGRRFVPVEEARQTLARHVEASFASALAWEPGAGALAPVHALRVSLGVGKTEAVLRQSCASLALMRGAGDGRAIVIAVPEHRLSAEVATRFEDMPGADGLSVAIWRGREAFLPCGDGVTKMCADIETVRKAQRLYADVPSEVCKVCTMRHDCAYLAQYGSRADLWIVSHASIFTLPDPIKEQGVALLIVDEAPWQSGLIGTDGAGIEVHLDALRPGALPKPRGDGPDSGARLEDLRERLRLAIEGVAVEDRPIPIERNALAAMGFDADSGKVARGLEWKRKETGGDWRDRLDNATLGPMVALWGGVEDLMKPDGPERSGRLSLAKDRKTGARVIRVAGRLDVAEGFKVPTLLIDATLDAELVRPFWPNVEVRAQIDVDAPFMRVRQVAGRAFSKDMLAPPINGDAQQAKRRRGNRGKVRAVVEGLARENGGETLLVSNKAIVEAMRAEGLTPRVSTGWFNAIAGRDQWRDARTVIVVGRPLLSNEAAERIAGALTGAAPISGDYVETDATRWRRAAGELEAVPGKTRRHPDPMAERVREAIAEAQVMQAVGRGRGVNRTAETPLDVWILSDVTLTLAVDEFPPLDAVLNPSLRDVMLAEGGIAYADPRAAALAYPSLWPNHEAAKKALGRESLGTSPYRNLSYGNVPKLLTVAYRRAGVGRHVSRAVVDPALVPDPRASIEADLGPLAFFEVIRPEAQPEPADVIELRPALAANDPAAPEPIPVRMAGAAGPGVSALLKRDDPPAPEAPAAPAPVLDLAGLKALARDTGMREGDIARLMGRSHAHVVNCAHGRRRATAEDAARLAELVATLPRIQGRLL